LRHSLISFGNDMPKAKAHTTDLGARLTALRKAAGYTQVELAAELGTTQRMIAYYESRAEKARPPCCLKWLPLSGERR